MLHKGCIALALAAGLLAEGWAGAPTVRLQQPAGKGYFEVAGVPPADLDRLARVSPSPADWGRLFAVYVVGGTDARQPAVLGSYRVTGGMLRFEPRFPLVPGVRYRAVFRPSRLPGGTGADVRADFEVPPAKATAATVVRHVYPSRDRLPENQLKFYLHFSAPMSRGEAYRHIQLLNAAGKAVDLPFLELDEELWDPSGRRFTLFFDPGRIKRGLKPRAEAGPVLVEGKNYTLVIDRDWPDAAGSPLRETYRKRFRVLAPHDTPPDPKAWQIDPPPAGRAAPLTVRFGEPLDHALLQRLLWVTDATGRRVPGTIRVTDEETSWLFTPAAPWRPGRYDLVVDTTLEDLAGNSVGRPFEIDLFRPIRRDLSAATVRRSFEVK